VLGVERAVLEGGEIGEPASAGRGHVAPQQPSSDRGQVVEGLDQRSEMAVEQPGPGPGEQRVVVRHQLSPGIGGGVAVAHHRREPVDQHRRPHRAAGGVEAEHRVRRRQIGHPPDTDEIGDGFAGDTHCPRLAEQ
jgi:hypothetical protein